MKNVMIVLFLLTALFVAGCGNNSAEPKAGNVLEGFAQGDNSATGQTQGVDMSDNNQMKLVKNCDFLTAQDVKTICGSDVTMTKEDEMYGPCTFRFENDQEHALRLIYYAYPANDNKDRIYNYCISQEGAEEPEEFVCATPDDKGVYVYGDYYSITLGEEYDYPTDKVCEYEQIKELGKLVKKRIYG